MNHLYNYYCLGCGTFCTGENFVSDSRRCNYCDIPFSQFCHSCYIRKYSCEGTCNKVYCARCLDNMNQCVFDCDFTCTECCTAEFCYVLGGHICQKCLDIHDTNCGCIRYSDTEDEYDDDDYIEEPNSATNDTDFA